MADPLVVGFDHAIFSAQKQGGVSRVFVELAKHLALLGADVSVHAPLYVTDGLAMLDAVRVRGLHLPVFPGVTRLGDIAARALGGARSLDVAHSTWYPAWRPRDARVVAITVHDMIAELFPADVVGGERQRAAKQSAVRDADVIFCVSNNTREDLVRLLGVPRERTLVTPLASSLGKVEPTSFASSGPFILYVGHRAGYKNFLALAQAFLASPRLRREFRLVCFGGPPFTETERALFRHCAESGPGSVQWLNGDDSALAAAYRNARIYVCTSSYEGFGLPVLEAMSCGCPVMAGGAGSIPEVGATAVAYVEALTADGIRDRLERILFDDSLLQAMSRQGLERNSDFSWTSTAVATLRGYREALA